jgi:hypothetical protein
MSHRYGVNEPSCRATYQGKAMTPDKGQPHAHVSVCWLPAAVLPRPRPRYPAGQEAIRSTVRPPASMSAEATRPAGGRATTPGTPGHLVSQGTHSHVCQYPSHVVMITRKRVVSALPPRTPCSQAIRTDSRLHRMRAVTVFSVLPGYGYTLRGYIAWSEAM